MSPSAHAIQCVHICLLAVEYTLSPAAGGTWGMGLWQSYLHWAVRFGNPLYKPWNHRVRKVGGDHLVQLHCLSRAILEHIALDCVQMGLECLQCGRQPQYVWAACPSAWSTAL